jgi:hypothetical protein
MHFTEFNVITGMSFDLKKTVKFEVLLWNCDYKPQIYGKNCQRPPTYNIGDASFMADI